MCRHGCCSWKPIAEFINHRFEQFLESEVMVMCVHVSIDYSQLAVRRKRLADVRIHCLLYFIAPTGHGYVMSHHRARGHARKPECGRH